MVYVNRKIARDGNPNAKLVFMAALETQLGEHQGRPLINI